MDLYSACLKTSITTVCLTVLMDLEFWVLNSSYLSLLQEGTIVIIALCLIKAYFGSHCKKRHEAEMQVIKAVLCYDVWQIFALVTVQSCAVCMEVFRDNVIVLLHNAKFQAASSLSLRPITS